MSALIVVPFRLRVGASPNQLTPRGDSLLLHPSNLDHGETCYYPAHLWTPTAAVVLRVSPPPLSPIGQHLLPLRRLRLSFFNLFCYIVDWFDFTTRYQLKPFPRSLTSRLKTNPTAPGRDELRSTESIQLRFRSERFQYRGLSFGE